jgi:hypothetical protein
MNYEVVTKRTFTPIRADATTNSIINILPLIFLIPVPYYLVENRTQRKKKRRKESTPEPEALFLLGNFRHLVSLIIEYPSVWKITKIYLYLMINFRCLVVYYV